MNLFDRILFLSRRTISQRNLRSSLQLESFVERFYRAKLTLQSEREKLTSPRECVNFAPKTEMHQVEFLRNFEHVYLKISSAP